MSWLRVDDSFTNHPKFSGWKSQEKWGFLELMSYCARYRTEGLVPNDLTLLPRAVNARLIKVAEASGWLDRAENGDLWIHDWRDYNPKDPTAASRQQALRDRNANRYADRDETVTRAQASRPVPYTSPNGSSSESEEKTGAYFISRAPEKFSATEEER